MAVAEVLGTIGWGLITNFISNRVEGPVMEQLTAGKRLENHDLQRALHLAFVQAQERIGNDCLKLELSHDDRLVMQQRLAALQTERRQLARVQTVNPPLHELEEIALLVSPSRPEVAGYQQDLARRLMETAAPEAGPELPRQYRDRLQAQVFEWMGRFFMALVKSEPVVFRALTAEMQALQSAYLMEHGAQLAEIKLMLRCLLDRLCPVEPSAVKSVPVELKNTHYVERPALEAAAATGLDRTGAVVLCGLGGVGKTQAAAHYAGANWGAYRYIFWLHAEEDLVLGSQYAGLAAQLNLPVAENREETIAVVRRWLEQAADWLLIFDNAKGPEDLEPYRPYNPKGHVLITSRNQDWGDGVEVAPVRPFDPADSVAYLLDVTGQQDAASAAKLAEELGHLPLALAQAGAYIRYAKLTTLASYLERFRINRQQFLNKRRAGGYPHTVATTWQISFEAMQQELPAANLLMNLCAFLGPEPVPLSLFATEDGELTGDVREMLQTAEDAERLISLLCQYTLMDVNPQQRTLNVHRLVQEVVRDQFAESERREWCARALGLVTSAFTFAKDAPETWAPSERVMAQALAVVEHGLALGREEEARRLLNDVGRLFRNSALYAQARSAFAHTLAVAEQVYGPAHPTVAAACSNLGVVLQDLGDLAGARAQVERALAIAEKVYGPDHPNVAVIRENLKSVS